MPIYANPVNIATCCPAGCEAVTPVSPLVTVTDQGECISEPLGVIAYQSQQLDMKWVLRAANGSPIDLTGCVPSSVVMRMQEGATRLGTVVEAACTINDRVKGGITLTIPAASMTKPGVYELQFALSLPLDVETNVVRFINRGYLIIENSLFADTADQGSLGPPLVSEILMGVRSGDPSRSDLLREKEWNLSEIAQALIQPVEFWNDALPPVEYYFSTTDFTFRHAWRGAAIALLMQMAGHGYLRDDANYQGDSPGATFQDKAKWQMFLGTASSTCYAYTTFVLSQKVAYNQRQSFGFLGTPYSFLGP